MPRRDQNAPYQNVAIIDNLFVDESLRMISSCRVRVRFPFDGHQHNAFCLQCAAFQSNTTLVKLLALRRRRMARRSAPSGRSPFEMYGENRSRWMLVFFSRCKAGLQEHV